ncbi:MAG: hypothetical protein C0501_19105 [Isosphaera sp.]|nr:hypothetical protein [Isosphaera sp.]
MRTVFGTLAAVLLAAAAAPRAGAAMIVLGPGEVDIAITFEGGQLGLVLAVDDTGDEFDPADALLFVGPAARVTQPPGAQFAFLGAGAGNPVWIVPQIEDPDILYLGIKPEDEVGDNLVGNVRIGFVAARGPGEFSVFQADAFGGITVFASTVLGGLTADDAFFLPVDSGDVHLNYAFTATGLYEVDIVLSGILQGPEGTPVTSEVFTLTFGVETTGVAAVPEPASCGLLAVGGVLAWRRGRRAA